MSFKKPFQQKIDALTFLILSIGLILTLCFASNLPVWAAATASAFVAVTIRQFLIGKVLDIFVSLALFALLFITNSYYFYPLGTHILLIIGALYIFLRQCFSIYRYHSGTRDEGGDSILDNDDIDL